MLTYRRSDSLEIVGYSDADLGGCADKKRSTTGYIFTLAGGAISRKSVKQTIATQSTMQAEVIACCAATEQDVWLKNFVPGLRIVDSISKPITIYCDNRSAVLFSGNNKSTNGSRSLDLKYYVVKDRTQAQTIKVEHISTKLMLVDPLTKGLPHIVFK